MELSITVCRPDELDQSLVELWRRFQQERPDLRHPFLTPQFVQVFGRHSTAARVAVLQQGGETVGFLPYERRRLGEGRTLAYGLSDSQGVVHGPDLDWAHVYERFMSVAGVSVLQFDHLVGYQGARLDTAKVQLAASPTVDVSMPWEEWLAGKRRTNWQRINTALQKQRKMGREVGELRFETDARDGRLLETLMGWKSAQYRRTGRFDRFAKPWFRAVVQECFEQHGEDFAGRLTVLYAGETPVHIDLSLVANGVIAGWFPAYDTRFAHYSPGFVSMLEMIKAATRDPNILQLDMGKGPAPYKESLKSFEKTVAEGFIDQASVASLAWRARTMPKRVALQVVLGDERLRLTARRLLNRIGTLRSRFPVRR